MPPRFAYWTILIDHKPTAFRAAKREELQPTFAQLKRTNTDVVMKWFARGRLWDDPEQAQWASRNAGRTQEKRGRDWRPGGNHRDPRAQFDRRQAKHAGGPPRPPHDGSVPPRDPERRPPPHGAAPPRTPHAGGNRPGARKPPRGPWQRDRKPADARAREDRPWKGKAAVSRSHDGKPRQRGARPPWTSKRPHGGGPRPWRPGVRPDDRRRRRDDDPGGDDK
jgi:hypothetical protein